MVTDKNLNLDTLLIQLRPISEKYKLFGIVAGISPTIINEIEVHVVEPYDRLVEVCDSWLKKCRIEDRVPTWNAVAEILTVIGYKSMAHEIIQVYQTGNFDVNTHLSNVLSWAF